MKIRWQAGKFADGAGQQPAASSSRATNCAGVYLYREIEVRRRRPTLPVSLGSDDTLIVWLNGEKILAENVQRAVAPDQDRADAQAQGRQERRCC